MQDRDFDEVWEILSEGKEWNQYSENIPLLAHYTSIETFEKIIKNEEIWLSNPLNMNDMQEMRFMMLEGARIFKDSKDVFDACDDSNKHAQLIHAFDDLFNLFDSSHAINTYVICFTEHKPNDYDGKLSMWRGYGGRGKGAAMVFDLNGFMLSSESPLKLRKVEYASEEKRIKLIENKVNLLTKILIEKPYIDPSLIASNFIEELKKLALFTKHCGFDEEDEIRLVYLSEWDKENLFEEFYGYTISNRGIEPKLKLDVRKIPGVDKEISIEKLINKILLGPSISNILSESSVKKMMKILNKESLIDKIFSSTTPFRD